jgi:subtilisin family serine protease
VAHGSCNDGSVVDVIALGVAILSTTRGGGYATMSGTSMAAPHAASGGQVFDSPYLNAYEGGYPGQ